jgi:predicted nucleic acid-binding protein
LYLLDKNVLDEIRDDAPNENLVAWFNTIDDTDMFLSVTSIMEGRKGIEQLRAKKPAIAAEIEKDLQAIVADFGDRIVPIDVVIADRWGRLFSAKAAKTKVSPCIDAAIAASAHPRNLTVVTRNTKDFKGAGVKILNPFKKPPEKIDP